MTIFDKRGIFSMQENCVVAILTVPRRCQCGRMAVLVVNRDGKTLCVECDAKRQAAA